MNWPESMGRAWLQPSVLIFAALAKLEELLQSPLARFLSAKVSSFMLPTKVMMHISVWSQHEAVLDQNQCNLGCPDGFTSAIPAEPWACPFAVCIA